MEKKKLGRQKKEKKNSFSYAGLNFFSKSHNNTLASLILDLSQYYPQQAHTNLTVIYVFLQGGLCGGSAVNHYP